MQGATRAAQSSTFKGQQNQRFAFYLSWQERQRIRKFAPKNNRFPEPKGITPFSVGWMNLSGRATQEPS